MGIVVSLIVGFIAGALASLVVRGRGFGCVGNIVVGLIGGFVGGLLFETSFKEQGFWGSVFISFVGAFLLLLVIKIIKSV